MRFLLVIPRFLNPLKKNYEFPLGIAYISAALKQAGEQVFCLNLNETQEPVEIAVAQAVNDFDPDVCGSGTLSPFLKNVKEVFTASRKAKANIVNVVGGGVFSGDPELAKNTLDIDIGVFGEGEEAIVEIAKALEDGQDLTAIQGLLVKCGDDRWIKTEARKSIRNLDDIPWPDMASFGLAGHIDNQTTGDSYLLHPEDQPRAVSMIASRSCPYSCTFCFHPIGRVYRERGLDDFFAELDHYVETYNINLVAILDELFAVKKERLRAFCRRIKPYGLKWTVQLHVSAADPDVLDMMKEAGCVYISYGLESMAPDVLKSMQKKATVEQIERALKLTRERRIGIQGNFIFGDPAETVESAATTIDWWAKNRAYMANLSVIQLYPGTPIYNQAMASGRFFKNSNTMIDPLQNVTSIDDETVVKMREFLQVFDQTLLWPAKILSFKESKKKHKTRGQTYDIDWVCPDCQTENRYRDVLLDSPFDHFAIRLTCRHCYARSDIQNLAQPLWRDDALEAKLKKADAVRNKAIASGNFTLLREAIELYRDIALEPYHPGQANRPEAVIQASATLARIYEKLNQNIDDAVGFYLKAVTYRPFDPELHYAFALVLATQGLNGAAKLHATQARTLVAPNDAANHAFISSVEAFLSGLSDEETEFMRYFFPPEEPKNNLPIHAQQ